MNQAQRKYAVGRVQFIASKKCEEIKQKYTDPGKELTPKEKLKLIRGHRVYVRDGFNPDRHRYDAWQYIFDFSEYETPKRLDQVSIDRDTKLVWDKAHKIIDDLTLGSCDGVLDMIKAFESETV